MTHTNLPRPPFNVDGFWPNAYPSVQNAAPPVQTNGSKAHVMNPIHTATATGNIFYKTRICHKFEAGKCLAGDTCIYAHGPDDLRQPPPNWREIVFNRELGKGLANLNDDKLIIRKMSICRDFYSSGACFKGENCSFLHEDPSKFKAQNISLINPSEVRESSAIVLGSGTDTEAHNSQWKSRLCTKWETKGLCHYGEQCRFAHGILELQHGEIPVVPMRAEEDVAEPPMKRAKMNEVIPKQIKEEVVAPAIKKDEEEDEGWKARWLKKKPRKIIGIYGDWIDGLSPPRGE